MSEHNVMMSHNARNLGAKGLGIVQRRRRLNAQAFSLLSKDRAVLYSVYEHSIFHYMSQEGGEE